MAAQPELLEMMSADPAPLSLETIDPAVPPAIQRLLNRHGPSTLFIRNEEVRFTWANVQLGATAIAITIESGAHTLQVELENLGAVDPLLIGEPFELLPPPLRALVVRRAVASMLPNVPRALAESLRVTEVRWTAAQRSHDWPIKLGFRLQRGENGCVTHGQLLARSSATLEWLDEQLPAQQIQRANLQALPIPIRLVLGRSDIPTSVLRKLAAGDVVWMQSARLTRAGINVDCRVGSVSAALATLRHQKLQFRNTHGLAMKLQQPTADVPAPPKSSAVDTDRTPPTRNLEIPVTFDAGELALPLAQLERLQPGALLELPQDVSDSTIQLRVGNSLIARGALVAIGKRLGVRITHVYLEEHESIRGAASPT